MSRDNRNEEENMENKIWKMGMNKGSSGEPDSVNYNKLNAARTGLDLGLESIVTVSA